ncbi:uncharacterized protein A1O9_00819 [Exophiala aquamarina CBS 119918]|uniref:rRNA adenine N(6)-methyltransferase n=1 Tax=Exophiala aquamarina CBS 119918 TaxID=1182545 RepID=A0A072PSL1_9EURO|nr:uncharacterized protein A1O9_00819 [Exophiala aquamarina CBS 119918]KEF62846.1 hypothetical protein A1O9_00819 [Exophiala aquamarina CBS 119918]
MVIPSLLRRASTLARTRTKAKSASPSPSAARLRSSRNEITSPKLCDAILDRLRPSLPAPGTCDLIDVLPGNAVWSQKLHAILKPRRHILVEPDLTPFSATLTPLLEASGSKYRHATLLEDVLDPEKGFLSEYPQLHQSSPNRTQLNPNLLLTVNLSGPLTSRSGFVGSMSKVFINNLWHAIWGQRGDLYRNGMFRTLAWIPSQEKGPLLPHSVAIRRKQSITLEASATVHELAAPSKLDRQRIGQGEPWADLAREGYLRVQSASKAEGISIPRSRKQPLPPPPLLTLKPGAATLRDAAFTSDAKWVPQLIELDNYLKEHDTEWYTAALKMDAEATAPRVKPLEANSKRKAWRLLMSRIRTEHNTRTKAIDLVNQQRLLERQWKDAILASPSGLLKTSAEERLRREADSLGAKLKKLARNNRVFAEKAIDDFRAYDHKPRVLLWNHRIAEPLLVHKDEFSSPHHQMAFFDILPKADLTYQLDTEDKVICFGHLMSLISFYSSKSVHEVCSMIIPAGVDDFIKTIKGIQDPTKGGWYDPNMLRIRSLPVDLIVEIALAFERWPFRPTTQSLLAVKSDFDSTYKEPANA